MSLYRRKDSPFWWFKIKHNGKTIQKSTGTEDEAKAQEYFDKLKASLWDQARLGIKPKRTWQDAVIRYLSESSHKASIESDRSHLRWLDKHLGKVTLGDINRDLLDTIVTKRSAQNVSNSTVNRMLEIVRAILRKATDDWEWIDKSPKIRMLPEPKIRIRWIRKSEARALVNALPSHLAAMVTFSLETGLRQANVTGLKWSQVDLEKRTAWIHCDEAKGRKAIPIPLSGSAIETLKGQVGQNPTFVFSYKGKRVTQVNTKAWRKALTRVGIENFRWHDLRHTWASWHVQAGTPINVLQELGGWECIEMVRKYAHLSSAHLTSYVDKLESF